MSRILKSPYFKILLSFTVLILTGALLLMLPWSADAGKRLSFIDALFTATSAVCITGLNAVSNYGVYFSVFGKIVLALLMEIGGLSILTVTCFIFVILRRKVGVSERFLLKEALNQNSAKGVVRLVITIVISTLCIQFAGACLSLITLAKHYSFGQAVAISVFHAISSFNNAGLDIFGYGDSMAYFSNDIFFNITTMLLIVLGGLGFVVLRDLCSRKKPKDLLLITKIVLPCTVVLIVSGMLLLKLAQREDITWLQALFQSVSARTAGFSTYDLSQPNNAEYTSLVLLMIIGGSPCSTAGGLKITTVFVIILTIFSYSVGKDPCIYKRRIAEKTIFKAFSLMTLVIMYLSVNILIFTYLEPGQQLRKIIFESISAISNAGLSSGLVQEIGWGAKLLLILSMFIGRLGPMTFINIWNRNWMRENRKNINYVEENLMVG